MAGRKSDFTLPTNTLDELFSTQEERDDAKLSKIRDIPLELIDLAGFEALRCEVVDLDRDAATTTTKEFP